jgi:hypothetical protein
VSRFSSKKSGTLTINFDSSCWGFLISEKFTDERTSLLFYKYGVISISSDSHWLKPLNIGISIMMN